MNNEIKPKNSTRRLIAGILLIVGAALLIIQSLGVFGAYAMGISWHYCWILGTIVSCSNDSSRYLLHQNQMCL